MCTNLGPLNPYCRPNNCCVVQVLCSRGFRNNILHSTFNLFKTFPKNIGMIMFPYPSNKQLKYNFVFYYLIG